MKDLWLLISPQVLSFRNRLRHLRPDAVFKASSLFVLGALFWVGTFYVIYRVLVYFQGVPEIGDYLTAKLLSMVFLTFFTILLFSNAIISLSSYYLSQDLFLLLSSPVSLGKIYLSKLGETLLSSSWMVLLFGLPVFMAYGIVYEASVLYYLQLIAVLIPFLILPAALGVGFTMTLVNAFPARRIKDIFLLLSLVLVVSLYLLFRFLQPEKLVDPESFNSLVEYFARMAAPSSALLPSHWATEALLPLLQRREGEGSFYLGLLVSNGAAALIFGHWLFSKLYYEGWNKSQEGRSARISQSWLLERVISLLGRPFSLPYRALLIKDIKTFLRDRTQWSQLFLLSALVVVYLYNFSVLPLQKSPLGSFYLQNLLSFLNLALAGFVLAAVGVRFVFPAISMERNSFWIIRSSPLELKGFLWGKFWISLLPLLILAEALIILTNLLLQVTPFMMGLSAATIFLLTFGIAGLGVGLGAIYPRFQVENVSQIATGFGGIIYMIYCLLFVGTIVILEAWPVYLIFMAKLGQRAISPGQWAGVGLSFATILILNTLAVFVPMRIGLARLSEYEV
jgi:ABC-2 type transport system permease protein